MNHFPEHIVSMAKEIASFEGNIRKDLRDDFAVLGDALEEYGAPEWMVYHCRDTLYHNADNSLLRCRVIIIILQCNYWQKD